MGITWKQRVINEEVKVKIRYEIAKYKPLGYVDNRKIVATWRDGQER